MNATYGTVRPSIIDVATDVDIFYHYRQSRTADDPQFTAFRKISDPTEILSQSNFDNDGSTDALAGMFRLDLPLNIFSRKGIYTIYIKPREYRMTILDIGTLQSYPDIRGVVLNRSAVDGMGISSADQLVGYSVNYYTGTKNDGIHRIITSANWCNVSTLTQSSQYQNITSYTYSQSGGLCFLTVTPSAGPGFDANTIPYIGSPSKAITLSNTKFDPLMVEVEMVDHDIETLSVMLEGEQLRNLENGRVTHFNFDGEVYKQFEFSTVKDNYTTNSVAELKLDKSDNVDTSLDMDELREA